MRRLIALALDIFKELLVNEFDCNFQLRCLVLGQEYFAEPALTEQAQLNVLREQTVPLKGFVLANLQQAIEKLFIVIEEYVSLDASNEFENESFVVLAACLRLVCC